MNTSELLGKLRADNAVFFTDGNRASASCASAAGIRWYQVKRRLLNGLLQFALTMKHGGQAFTAGTQLVKHVPSNAHEKCHKTGLVNPELWNYVCRWQ